MISSGPSLGLCYAVPDLGAIIEISVERFQKIFRTKEPRLDVSSNPAKGIQQ